MPNKNINLEFSEDSLQENNHYYYLSFKDGSEKRSVGESVKQVLYDGFNSEEVKKEKIELVLDFDVNSKLIGIEIISDRNILP